MSRSTAQRTSSVAPDTRAAAAPTGDPAARIRIADWGRVEYGEARRRQLELWERRVRGEIEDIVILVEHPAVITLGRHAPQDDLLLDRAALEQKGIAVVRTDRGGRATYHGPGQAVVYPIVSIAERGIGVKDWVELLEDALMETLDSYAIASRRTSGQPGIWVGDAKIASIGLRVARGVSYHGISINVDERSKNGFEHIVTCGVRDQRVTSLQNEAPAVTATVGDVAARFCAALTKRLSSTPDAP